MTKRNTLYHGYNSIFQAITLRRNLFQDGSYRGTVFGLDSPAQGVSQQTLYDIARKGLLTGGKDLL